MGQEMPPNAGGPNELGPQLEAALIEACDGRLRDIHWFRTDWQRGGAATGYAVVTPPDPDRPTTGETGRHAVQCCAARFAEPVEVVIKVPIGPREHRAASKLFSAGCPQPGIAFSGLELGGYDFAWMVMEKLPGEPMSSDLCKRTFRELMEAGAAFQRAALESWPVGPRDPDWEWPEHVARARESAHINPIPHAQEWNEQLKKLERQLERIVTEWRARPTNGWCHGDLHPGNLMRRPEGSPWGDPGCVLLDFAEVHAGHWVEDAVYVERIYWAKPELMGGAKPVSLLAKARRELGLSTDDEYRRVADLRRLLMAGVAPAFIHREGHPLYLDACLAMVKKLLPAVA